MRVRRIKTDCYILQIYEKSPKKLYPCPTCGRHFKTSRNLGIHFMIHTGDRPFKCLQCEKGFCKKDDLTRHMRVHTGEKPFECNICRKRFSLKSNVKSHRLTHLKINE
jgi:uncharacterized Zn-finger protein